MAAEPCREPGCRRRKLRGKHRCYWHWLMRQNVEVQERAAAQRLARTPEERRRSRVPAGGWPAGKRWCAGCQWMVPMFYCRGSRCRACASRAAHRGAAASRYVWPEGMTYDLLLARQRGRCAICRCLPQTRRLAVDHDHTTGEVRGLLCTMCNHELLAAAHESVELLRNAVYYLEHPPAGTTLRTVGV